jgi:hypothetical protein
VKPRPFDESVLNRLPSVQSHDFGTRIAVGTVTKTPGGETMYSLEGNGDILLVSYELWPEVAVPLSDGSAPFVAKAIGRDPERGEIVCHVTRIVQ